jgi:4-hydroxy-tetrahydrodipicolinate reductase
VRADPELTLVGVVEREGCEDGLDAYGCVCGTELGAMLPEFPGAVVIDFTAPQVSLANARVCAEHGNPIVIGTTGLSAEEQAELRARGRKGPGVLVAEHERGRERAAQGAARADAALGESYDIEMVELHHNQKRTPPAARR